MPNNCILSHLCVANLYWNFLEKNGIRIPTPRKTMHSGAFLKICLVLTLSITISAKNTSQKPDARLPKLCRGIRDIRHTPTLPQDLKSATKIILATSLLSRSVNSTMHCCLQDVRHFICSIAAKRISTMLSSRSPLRVMARLVRRYGMLLL